MHRRLVIVVILVLSSLGVADTPPAPDLGANVSLNGRSLVPEGVAWGRDVSKDPLDPDSRRYLQALGLDKPLRPDFGTVWQGNPMGIPYVVVGKGEPRSRVTFEYADESDPGPYPIPRDPPIEGGPQSTGDRHILMLDRDTWMLYELFNAHPPKPPGDPWTAGSGAIFDLKQWKPRPDGWTSADAAGLPILPLLVRYDEVVEKKSIDHALRFTVQKTRNKYVAPASHYASRRTDASLLPMGARLRLRADFDESGFPPEAQVIIRALKKHGMILADNGSDLFITGSPHEKWNDDAIQTLRRVKAKDFEVLKLGQLKP